MNRRIATSLLTIALSLSPLAAWSKPSPAEATVRARVEARLANNGFGPTAGVYVTFVSGKAVLEGVVETLRDSQRAAHLVAEVNGVAVVANNLRVATVGRPDGEIRADLQQVLDVNLDTEVFDWIEAEVEAGQVLLTGQATNPVTASRIAKAVARVPGVWRIFDNVEVLPVSAFDEQLRREALVAIYRHPAFFDRAIEGTPSIHILVANGRIALKGKVPTRIQAKLAESLVRSGTTHFGVDNQILVTSRVRS